MYFTQQTDRLFHRYESQPELVLIVGTLVACLAILLLVYVCNQLRTLFWTHGSNFESDDSGRGTYLLRRRRDLDQVRGHRSSNGKRAAEKHPKHKTRRNVDASESDSENERMNEYREQHSYRSSGGNMFSRHFNSKRSDPKPNDGELISPNELHRRKAPIKSVKTLRNQNEFPEEEAEIDADKADSIRFNWNRKLKRKCDCGCRYCCSSGRSAGPKQDSKEPTKRKNLRKVGLRNDSRRGETEEDLTTSDSSDENHHCHDGGKVRSTKRSKDEIQRKRPLVHHLSKVSRTSPLYGRLQSRNPSVGTTQKSWSSHFHLSKPQISRCHFDSS